MPETKDTDRSLSDIQLDDFDVNRQRERLEQSRPGNLQSDQKPTPQQPDEQSRQGEKR
ncbi:hypothetical protein LK542_23205 [Massilia sp. IC2-477]|uniref:hypothetical protein n=1 Tax=unclassified Massilia TaxID=2609279 RepID=UPI001D12F88E|nr:MULTISPECIES: hypothetical protein [unclassified Massilia]MCC2958525.1 hypothetical protein [Massilia sp. IC2-477]MCC2973774.1 hypothetical protein [Massilia sp. IC2-476]